VFDGLSTGAADDIAKATDIARDRVMRYGMAEGMGYVSYAAAPPRFLDLPGTVPYRSGESSPQTAQRIDAAVQRHRTCGLRQVHRAAARQPQDAGPMRARAAGQGNAGRGRDRHT
jgi:hypothetical protein